MNFSCLFDSMIVHKIQTGEGSFLSLQVKEQKSQLSLVITKGNSTLIFSHQQTSQLNAIVQSIDGEKISLKEYGSFKKWSEIFKVSLSEFRWIKNFQIREWISSVSYNGFGKQGISLPIYKVKEFQTHLTTVIQEFDDIIKNN